MATEAQGFAWETAATHQSVDLTEAECWTLLASQGTGRVAYQDNGRVLVFPVNYVVHDTAVYFRTAREGVLGGGLDYRNAPSRLTSTMPCAWTGGRSCSADGRRRWMTSNC